MVKTLLQKISDHQTKHISMAALILSVFSFLSFLLGLLRDRLLTGSFGSGLDTYFTAFRIPDFIAMVLMTGAIGVAVIPIFTKNLVKDKESAFKYLSNLLNLSLVGLIIICVILFIFTPQLISLIAPGFSGEKREVTAMLTRIMFLSPILMGISNIISAVLRIFQRFLITALAPVFYNLGSIIGILFFVPVMGIKGLAWGIVLGAGMHLVIQVPALFKTGFKIAKTFNLKDEDFLQTIKLTIPRAVGLAATQINLIVVTIIGSTLVSGSITFLSLANDLSLPIIGLIAVPFATAVFPALSLSFSRGERKEMVRKFSSVFRQILFLIIPISAIAFVLRAHLVRIVFGTGKFDWPSTKLTAACFGVFMLGLFAQGLIYLLAKAFYSMHNTKIPALVSIISILSTALFGIFFVWVFSFQNFFSNFFSWLLKIEGMKNISVVGLPLAISLDAILQMAILIIFLRKTQGVPLAESWLKEVISSLKKIVLATLLTLIFAYFIRQFLGGYMGSKTFWILVLQASSSGILGFLVYVLFAWLFKSPEVVSLKNFVISQMGFLNFKKNGKNP